MREKNAAGQRKRKAPVPARLETSSGGVVFRVHEGVRQFLLIKDPYDNWGLPKGHVEGGETPLQAAIREVTEETGLCELSVVEQLPTIDWYFKDHGHLVHKFCHFFLLQCAGGDARPQLEEGISECSWKSIEEALHAVTYANAREVLRIAGERVNS
ncbi:MAG TPA: NUDIX hydrolase [Longimicrobiales bacterium]|nr:NUDIX hydrolase [Longimicrobiales bacterium]